MADPIPQMTPWRQGWDAAHEAAVAAKNSASVDDNPYPEGTREHDEWGDGYRAGWYDEYPEDANDAE